MDNALYEEHDLHSDAVKVRQLHFVEPFVFTKEEDVRQLPNKNVSLPNIFPNYKTLPINKIVNSIYCPLNFDRSDFKQDVFSKLVSHMFFQTYYNAYYSDCGLSLLLQIWQSTL